MSSKYREDMSLPSGKSLDFLNNSNSYLKQKRYMTNENFKQKKFCLSLQISVFKASLTFVALT